MLAQHPRQAEQPGSFGGLYLAVAPLHFVVYEDETGKTFVAYDTFVSLLAQYQREEVTQVAQVVEQKMEALLTAVTQ